MTDDMRSPEEDTAPGPTPVLRPEADAPAARTILSAAGQELARAIGAANKAVGFLKALGDREVSVNVITVMECMGSTQDEALQAAADAIRFSDGLVLHGVQWARIPGVEDRIISSGDQQWEYRVLLLVSAIDPDFGEADNPAHQADAGDCSTVLYLDAGVEEPSPRRCPRCPGRHSRRRPRCRPPPKPSATALNSPSKACCGRGCPPVGRAAGSTGSLSWPPPAGPWTGPPVSRST
ncbi:hypothetical protein ACFQ0M_48900 [Kitasatospora aburaviensis]